MTCSLVQFGMGAAPAWSPSKLPGLALWLESDLGVTTGATFTWADQSGSGNNFHQTTAGNQPTVNASDAAYNGQATLSFTGGQFLDQVSAWAATVSQPYTIMIVGSDSASGNNIFVGQPVANNWYIAASGGLYGVSISVAFNATTPDSTTPKILYVEYDDPSSSTFRVSQDTPEVTGNAGAAATLPTLELAGADAGINHLSGKLAMIVVCSGILSSANRALLQSYAGRKYGIGIGS
jgi:hypothetical protein